MAFTIERITIDDPRFDAFLRVAGNAYFPTTLGTDEGRERYRAQVRAEGPPPEANFYVAQVDGVVVGGMRLYDFVMRVRSNDCPTGGLGFVCIDYPFKQRGYARELVRYYLAHYRERGAVAGALYPFRPDFYRALGFGYGRKLDVYRFAPAELPADPEPRTFRLLRAGDEAALIACYDRTYERTSGMMRKHLATVTRHLGSDTFTVAGYERAGNLAGYVMFSRRQREEDNLNTNELYVDELIYDDADAFRALMGFLRRQGDQFATIVVNAQDDGFEWILRDPRSQSRRVMYRPSWHESNVQAMGIMYRSLATSALLDACAGRDFGAGTCTIAFEIADALLPENAGTTVVRFEGGWGEVVTSPPDVTVRLDVAEFSALIMGAVRLRPLVEFGVVHLSDGAWLETADAVLAAAQPPRCTTWF